MIVFNEIDRLREEIEGVEFVNIPRDGNSFADSLAKIGINRSDMVNAWL